MPEVAKARGDSLSPRSPRKYLGRRGASVAATDAGGWQRFGCSLVSGLADPQRAFAALSAIKKTRATWLMPSTLRARGPP